MSILKKLGALTGASSLVAAGIVAIAANTAFAAPLTLNLDSEYYTPGDQVTVTIGGCSAGGTIDLTYLEETKQIVVPDSGAVEPVVFTLPTDRAGKLEVGGRCTPAAGSGEEQTLAQATATVLDQTLIATPSSFAQGDTISLKAGEFVPGTKPVLTVTNAAGKVVWTFNMGTVGDDMLVVSDVTFPASLECGKYTVKVATADNSVDATLTMCRQTPSPTATASPTATTPVPTTSPAPTTPAPTTTPKRPGLPGSGN